MSAESPGTPRSTASTLRGWTAALAVLTWLVPPAFAQSAPGLETPVEVGVVNLNTANIDELSRLPGIGPARARAVLELRRKLTHFSRLEDLMRVRGIGRKTFRKLQPLIRLSGATTLQARSERPCPESGASGVPPSP
jgi:competence protein ComEA